MTKFTEGRHAGEGLISEANFNRSRDAVVIASGSGVIAPGTILGKITASGKFVPSTDAEVAGKEGADTASAIALYGCDATSEDVSITAITRDAEWNGGTVTYHSSVNSGPKKAAKADQLRAAGIILR